MQGAASCCSQAPAMIPSITTAHPEMGMGLHKGKGEPVMGNTDTDGQDQLQVKPYFGG